MEIPLEFQKFMHKVAAQVESIVAIHDEGTSGLISCFRVEVSMQQGSLSTIVGYNNTSVSATIPVHYEALELNCSLCGHHQHSISQCHC